MRPYLAIIKDSFRAALASRVLYVLLGLILLFLLIIAPLHVRESLDTRVIIDRDVRPTNQMIMIERIREELEGGENAGMKRIWDSLTKETRDRIDKIIDGEKDQKKDLERAFVLQTIESELNDLIESDDFFREEDWQNANLGSEARNYIEKGIDSLSEKEKQRLNRVLVSESFSGMIRPGAKSSLDFYYGPFNWSAYLSTLLPTNVSRDQFASTISSQITMFLDKIVLSIGLLIAILVTANVVPQTFEAGTLNLLLSKPLARAGLFLAKFVGGCMFIALCASLLFVGLWLWMGFGLGIWERAVLISIPLYILVFAIYYSVSALTGLMTRSTILAIVATGLFWGLCWSVGTIYQICSSQMEAFEIKKIVQMGDTILQVDPGTEPMQWSKSENEWKEFNTPELDQEEKVQRMIFRYMGDQTPFPKPFGPVYVESLQKTAFGRVLAGDTSTHVKQQFFISNGNGGFDRRGVLPTDAKALVPTRDSLICVNRRGRIYRYDPNTTIEEGQKPKKQLWFASATPDDRVDVLERFHVAVNWQNDEVAIYNEGTVTVFAVDETNKDRNYRRRVTAEIESDTPAEMTCRIEYQGDTIVLAYGNGQVLVLDAATLEKEAELLPETRVAIESMSASHDGRWFSLLYRDESLRVLDAETNSVTRPPFRGQGSISAVQFTSDAILVADRTDRVTSYSLDGFKRTETMSPAGTMAQKIWRYGIKPLYFAFPKPGEFYKVVTHLSTSADTGRNRDVDLTFKPVRPNPWAPLVSGLGFMFVMLSISCIIFSRSDY